MQRDDRQLHASLATAWKVVLTFLACLMYVTGTSIGVTEHSPLERHLIYIFCHANIFHLACNLLCLWRLKARLHVPEAVMIAVAVTWLPLMTGESVTMGMSGVLFAICGIQWGHLHKLWSMMKYCGTVVVLTALVPHMSWAVHAYALAAGFLYGWMLGYRHRDFTR